MSTSAGNVTVKVVNYVLAITMRGRRTFRAIIQGQQANPTVLRTATWSSFFPKYLYISSIFPHARVLSTTAKLQTWIIHHRHHHYVSPENSGEGDRLTEDIYTTEDETNTLSRNSVFQSPGNVAPHPTITETSENSSWLVHIFLALLDVMKLMCYFEHIKCASRVHTTKHSLSGL